MLRVCIFLILFVLSRNSFGQFSVLGTVFDCKNRTKIAEAHIEIEGINTKTHSDKNGSFSLQNIPSGTHYLRISKDGYKSQYFLVQVKNNSVTNSYSICKDKEIEIDEVIVTATRSQKKLKNVPIPVQVITSSEIQKSQSVNFQNFLENEFSGINFTSHGGSPNINMMGFGGKYVLFLIDGERMAGETFDNIDYERINTDNIERIEIIKGASSSLYGSNAIGGVVNIITKKAQKPLDISAGYAYDTNIDHKANLSVGTKQNWGSLLVSSFYKMREPYLLKDSKPQKLYYKDNTVKELPLDKMHIAGITNYGISPKLSFQLSQKTDLEITPSYYFGERNDGTENAKKVRDRYHNYTIGIKSNYQTNDGKAFKFSGSFDRYDKFKFYPILGEEEKHYQNSQWQTGLQYNQNLSEKHTFVAGGEIHSDELMSLRFDDSGTQTQKSVKNYTAFTQQDWVFSKKFTLVTGARLDYHSIFREYFTFRLSAMYKTNDFTFRGGYSDGFRSPTLKELYTNWFHPWGGGFQISGNKDLKPESSSNFNFSVDYSRKNLNITAMTQYSVVRDKIDFLWTDSKTALNYTNFSGKTRIIGSEISASYRISRFHLKSSYSFYDIEKKLSDSRPHTFILKAEYLPRESIKYIPNIILSGKYVSSAMLHSGDETNTLEDYYIYYEPYWQWRLQISSKLPFGLTFNAGINNILDYKAPTVSFYSPITPGRTFYTGVKWSY